MAKIAKDAMKVKGTLGTYECSWKFATPIDTWDRAVLLANIRAGLRYAISRKITLTVLADEQGLNRHKLMLEKGRAKYGGDEAKIALFMEFLADSGIKDKVQTEYVFSESDFMNEPEDDEDAAIKVSDKVS